VVSDSLSMHSNVVHACVPFAWARESAVWSCGPGHLNMPGMKALVVPDFGGPDVLRVLDVTEQGLGVREVRIQVAASAVNAIDLSTRAGRMVQAGLMAARLPARLGWDVAGTVVEIGSSVDLFKVGDDVIGLRDVLSQPGTQAERVVLDQAAVAPAPTGWSLEEAATLPLAGLTALGALEAAHVFAGDRLLVTGAAGGVGGFVVELASRRGIEVHGLVRPSQVEEAGRLGQTICVTTPTIWPPISGARADLSTP
jgi:NADPH:quinone reductase